jgi:hypothetical protein
LITHVLITHVFIAHAVMSAACFHLDNSAVEDCKPK